MASPQQQWFYSTGSERYGPVGFDYLLELARTGKLDPRNDLVWTTTLGDWEPAGQIEGLFERRNSDRGDDSGELDAGLANTGSWEERSIPKAQFPGTGRLGYFVGTTVLPTVLTIGWFFAATFLMPYVPEDLQGFVPLAVFPLIMLLVLVTVVKRFRNLGMSGWCILGMLVPLLNLWLGYRLFACPGGYAERPKLDTPGVLLALIYWGGFAASIGIVLLSGVNLFGEMKESGMLDDILSQFHELMDSAVPEK